MSPGFDVADDAEYVAQSTTLHDGLRWSAAAAPAGAAATTGGEPAAPAGAPAPGPACAGAVRPPGP